MSETRIALVSGTSRGIGQAVADQLVASGHHVIGTATSESGAQAISDRLGDSGAGLVLRVNDQESVAALYQTLKDGPGLPTVLVNNAAVTRDNLLMRMKEEEWQEVIDTNLTGLYRLVKPALRGMMKARWGRIISLSSVVGRMGNPGQTNYVASKAGVEGFTRSLAAEVASRGITVNAVAPGFVETDMTAELTEAQRAAMLSRVPLGRMAGVDEIASVVNFLASSGAGYITGETIQVNGGLHMA